MKNYYNEIDKEISSYENFAPYHTKTIDWICNRIDWCWKWKKISQEQMVELADRICEVMEGELINGN